MRKRKNRDKKWSDIFKIISIILILIFVVTIPIVFKKLIIIKNITCESQYGVCPEATAPSVQKLVHSDLSRAKKQIEQDLGSSYLVESYLVQYQIPSTLKVELIIKKPKYAVKDGQSGMYYFLDKDGLILETGTTSNYSYVEVLRFPYTPGSRVDEKTFFASQIIYYVDWLYKVKSGRLESDSLIVNLSEGPKVIFPLVGDVESLIGGLRLIYSRLNENDSGIRIENVSQIDLRFDNPVIK